ncbi:MAG: flagellar basal body rod protein FlgC [Planctomycetaceae bacterium]
MYRSLDISTSGLVAQRQRMNTIAGNIANLHTTRGPNGEPAPFQRRLIRFQAEKVDGSTRLDGTSSSGGAGVTYRVEVDSEPPPRKVHDPGHPDADKDGYVAYPNVNLVTEFVNALEAGRAYEANVAAIEMSKQMAQLALRILG